MKIQSRFLLFLLSFFSIILVLGISAQFFSFRLFHAYLYNSVSEIFHSSVGSFTNSIHNIEQFSVTIMTDEATQKFLKYELPTEENDYAKHLARETLLQRLSLYTLLNPFFKEIILIDSEGSIYHANANRTTRSFFDKEEEELVLGDIRRETLALEGKQLWSLTESSLTPLLLSRKINLVGFYTEQPRATLYHFIDIEKLLDESFSQIKHYGLKSSIYYRGNLFYSLLGEESDGIRNRMEASRYKTVRFAGEPHLATDVKTGDGEWEFLFLIPAKELFKNFYVLNRILYLLYFVFFLFFTFLMIRSSKRFTSPIITLSREMKAIDDKDFVSSKPIELPAGASDEVRLLYYEFYQMIDKIDTLVNKNLKQQLSLKQAQMDVLSNQLNPHFLHNTLDSLYWMAEMNQQREMASLVKSLSSILRNTLKKDGPLVTIKEQLDLLNDYFFIQKMRFKERLEYSIDVDHQLYAEKIPRFTIPPLVENSIKYSLEAMNNKCRIEVSVKRSPAADGLDILIRDNGPGWKKEQTSSANTGIGLSNLQQRISLLYGEDGMLKVDTNHDGGADIIVFIPSVKGTLK